MPAAPVLKKLNKPALTLEKDQKMKAFVWKRVIIDIEGGTFEVVKNDLKALDPTWKGKQVIWKDIKESDRIDLKKCLEMYPAKVVQAKVTT